MFKRLIIASLVMAACALSVPRTTQAARIAPLYNPDPIQVPCGLPVSDVKKALWAALIGRTWNPVETGAGKVEAKVVVRDKHTLVVDVKYDAKSVLIRYKSSDNLNYRMEKDGPYIHKNANSWIRNIENDTRTNLNTYCRLK